MCDCRPRVTLAAVAGLRVLRAKVPGPEVHMQGPTGAQSACNLPGNVVAWLDGWGPKMLAAAEEGARNSGLRLRRSMPQPLRVGTDCSGLEAPVHALRALGLPHSHIFSCEKAKAPRRVLLANTRPVFGVQPDILQAVKEPAPPHVHMYISGFSCKPFSMLHWRSALLKEREAEIFFAVLKRIKALQPPCFVLENVPGISRCVAKVLGLLRKQGYQVVCLKMGPEDLGEPVCRPRYYFLGVRNGLAVASLAELEGRVQKSWTVIKQSHTLQAKISDRLLPASHPAILHSQALRKKAWETAAAQGFPDPKPNAKWRDTHAKALASGLAGKLARNVASHCSSDDLYLHLPRQRASWDTVLQTKGGEKGGGPSLAVDLSQGLGRLPCQTSGKVPTITPRGLVAVKEVSRVLAPLEKLLLHAIPLHRMIIPSGVSDSQLGAMGGNTMHVQVVAAAMLLTASMVNWGDPAASQSFRSSLRVQDPVARKRKASGRRAPGPTAQAAQPVRSRKLALAQQAQPKLRSACSRLLTRWGPMAPKRRSHARCQQKRQCGRGLHSKSTSFLSLSRWD